jgi:DNA-binding MarR family transcriptional regulator
MSDLPRMEACNCLALRQATRHVSQLYDRHLAPYGLTVSQFSIVARLSRRGPRSINELAHELVMDRTTLGRNLKPLERDGLVSVDVDPQDRRSRRLGVTAHGREVVDRARPAWEAAQREFETAFGGKQATALRSLLQEVVETDLAAGVGR